MTQETQENNSINSDNSDSTGSTDQRNILTIPYERFKEVNDQKKELAAKLKSYEDRDKAAQDAKLLEEKRFQELIASKEKEALEFKEELEKTRREAKIDKIKGKFSRILDKNNAINSEDVLRFVEIESFIDQEDSDIDSEITKMVDGLVKNKSYLFNPKANRSNSENRQLGSGQNEGTYVNKAKVNPVISQLMQIYKQ